MCPGRHDWHDRDDVYVVRRAVYELMAMVAYIEEAESQETLDGAEPGHLVAHIKVGHAEII